MSKLGGRYRLVRPLGEGGMGVVHEAEDERLGRRVAVKTIRSALPGEEERQRFLREARAAAALSHPNACQLYEIGEHDGRPFLVMELLGGQSLASRLAAGPLDSDEAIDVMLAVLRALNALHVHGLVHRDLKPSNIFLTPHGVKVLDFGLACSAAGAAANDSTVAPISRPGTLAGTPRYMAPEQLAGDPVDARTDLFAAGVVLFEMVAGRPPFGGHTAASVLQAILTVDAPRLESHPALATVVARALARRASDRYPNAEAMGADLSAARGAAITTAPPSVRIVVLPFRLLRADEEVAFLERALPEAITTSLSNITSILVRSNQAAVRLGPQADPVRAGIELDVNHVLTGTLQRAGSRLRATLQLIEVPGGRVAWSDTKEVPVGDLFELQDDICRHIVQSLPIEGVCPERKSADVPGSAAAYADFLRANQLATQLPHWPEALGLYERCVAGDPGFAPAWAMLGRLHRLTGKYLDRDVREEYDASARSFSRAFALHPTLSLTHHQFAYLEVEQGHSDRAMLRLATQIRERPLQAELWAALCHVARYCGLVDVSLAADTRARRLDPQVRSSITNTHLLVGDYASMLAGAKGVAETLMSVAYYEVGARSEALAICASETARFPPGTIAHRYGVALAALYRDDVDTFRREIEELFDYSVWFPDGEFHYYVARLLSRVGSPNTVPALNRAVERGFFPSRTFERDPWLQPARAMAGFDATLALAAARHRSAVEAFDAVGGYPLLGLKREPPSGP